MPGYPNDYRNVPLYWNDPLSQAKPAPTVIMKFEGSSNYVATPDLMLAVNAAMTLRRPLLVKGEPGTGKTMLAEEAAAALGLPLLEWHIKSTTKAQQGLYEYDAVSRLRDSQLGDPRVKDIHNYIVKGVLWQAFEMDEPCALLILNRDDRRIVLSLGKKLGCNPPQVPGANPRRHLFGELGAVQEPIWLGIRTNQSRLKKR